MLQGSTSATLSRLLAVMSLPGCFSRNSTTSPWTTSWTCSPPSWSRLRWRTRGIRYFLVSVDSDPAGPAGVRLHHGGAEHPPVLCRGLQQDDSWSTGGVEQVPPVWTTLQTSGSSSALAGSAQVGRGSETKIPLEVRLLQYLKKVDCNCKWDYEYIKTWSKSKVQLEVGLI